VKIVPCAQQTNGSDCGVYASAFLFEWATVSANANLNVKFNVPLVRHHLMMCLERQLVIPFPKLPVTRVVRQRRRVLCVCNLAVMFLVSRTKAVMLPTWTYWLIELVILAILMLYSA